MEIQKTQTGRLSVETVRHIIRLVGGNPVVETQALQFIADRYGAKDLFEIPKHVATAILKRPADFVSAARRHCEPELPF